MAGSNVNINIRLNHHRSLETVRAYFEKEKKYYLSTLQETGKKVLFPLIGSLKDDLTEHIKEMDNFDNNKLKGFFIEGIIKLSKVFFEVKNNKNITEIYGTSEELKGIWAKLSSDFLKRFFGGDYIYGMLDILPKIPEIRFGLIHSQKTNEYDLFSYKGYDFRWNQFKGEYSRFMAPLGLDKTNTISKIKNIEIKEFYKIYADLENYVPDFSGINLNTENLDFGKMPSFLEQTNKDYITKFTKDKIEWGVKTICQKAIKDNCYYALAVSNKEKKYAESKISFRKLKEKYDYFSSLIETENDANNVSLLLTGFYKGFLEKDSTPNLKYIDHYRLLGFGTDKVVSVAGNRWIDWQTRTEGKGAISLAAYLMGYSKSDEEKVFHWLFDFFGEEKIKPSIAVYLNDKQKDKIYDLNNTSYQLPAIDENNWLDVKNYLVNTLCITEDLVDNLHKNGLILSSQKKKAVFVCDKHSGSYILNIKGRPFWDLPRSNSLPFVLEGEDNWVYLCKNPVEALSLKSLSPKHTAIALGLYQNISVLQPYFEGKEICLVGDVGWHLHKGSGSLMKMYPSAINRLMVKSKFSLNYCLKNKDKIKVAKKNRTIGNKETIIYFKQ